MSATRMLLLSPSQLLGGCTQRYLASGLSELFDDNALRLWLGSAGQALFPIPIRAGGLRRSGPQKAALT